MKINAIMSRKWIVVGILLMFVTTSFGASAQQLVDISNKNQVTKISLNKGVKIDDGVNDLQINSGDYDHRYAVLVVGSYHGAQQFYTWYLRDIQRLYWNIAVKYGFNDEDIYVLVTLVDEFDEPEIFDPNIVDYSSTEANLIMVLNILKNQTGENNLFFFCVIDHGDSDGFELYNGWVSASEFASYVNGIPGELVFILQPCGSGGLIDELSGEDRIIGTSVKASESEGGWIGKFSLALTGFGDSDEEIGNQDGNVSIEEAHHYAARHVYERYGVHSLIDDNADSVGHHYTSNGYDTNDPSKDAYRAARTFFGGETVSNPPGKPDTPSGPTQGETGVVYEYSTKAIDPDGDPVLYGWDWDSNLEVDSWTHLSNSGGEITSKHKWSNTGVYEVRVKAREIHGAEGNWSDPLIVNITGNNPPDAPNIDGPINGKVGEEYEYTFTAVDPDGDDVSYFIKWDDGDEIPWTSFQPSGDPYLDSHIWNKEGNYIVQAKAKDIYGSESEWGTLEVSMPKNKQVISQLMSEWLLDRLSSFPVFNRIMNPTR